ncbi:GNAT family N-acetyltransferase [Chitinophaga nivalis]|uniref:GNAT family N-acetyltransferase n=1 Tax=Chitinophaga nivalis TaxID=2991709 RepID=A0ABT3IRV3_9BACT|nr:GNAT family N-acetyltransferase [Chitinophaga nivalis]MCW3463866.1 GNAT family N-acetyltransferase [Chitinophaga nivalis]MCW3486444.1 GNAT family N-acetyltransferase [Chitinophaga nivalis]
MTNITVQEGDYLISTDKSKLDTEVIHQFLATESYWAQGIPLSIVEKCIAGSLCFGLYHDNRQIGFARVITDGASFAYLADVFVVTSHRGKGLSKFIMRAVIAHPDLQGLRRWLLVTADAHSLYRQFGFTDITDPQKFLQLHRPQPYL